MCKFSKQNTYTTVSQIWLNMFFPMVDCEIHAGCEYILNKLHNKVIQTNFNGKIIWLIFVYTNCKVSYVCFSLWPVHTLQQVKSVIPKYSRKQNRDQTSDYVVIIQWSLTAYHDTHQKQWDRSHLNLTALVGYHCFTRPRLRLGLV